MSTTKSTTPVPLSAIFRADDADVVIRAAGTRDFRAHKLILSLVSPIFKDMFAVPQPPTGTPGTLPRVDVHDTAETWENTPRTIYHMPNPVINDLNNLESLFLAAKKYEMRFVTDSYEKSFKNRRFIQQDPLHLYAIACACGLDDQAKFVARNAELLTVVRGSQDLKGLTVAPYHRLVTFLAERDNELHPILERGWESFCCSCKCPREHVEFPMAKEKLKTPYTQMEEVYSRALGDRRRSGCRWSVCVIMSSEIKQFVERMIRERGRVCDKFMWK